MELIKSFRLSKMFNNAFLIKENNEIILIDAPGDIYKVINYLEENNLILSQVWLTHCHYDHIIGLNELKKNFPNLKVYISKEEVECVSDQDANLSTLFGSEKFTYSGEILSNEELLYEFSSLKLIYATGHSLNSTCYYFDKEKTLFSGDVIFHQTIGRSDLIYGNQEKLVKTIKEQILTLDNEVKLYAGHGFASTIGNEKTNNIVVK